MEFTEIFDTKLELTLGSFIENTYVRDELFSMVCNDNITKEDISEYIESYLEWLKEDENKRGIPPFYFKSSRDAYFHEHWSNILEKEYDLTIGEICQLNNLYLKYIMGDDYGNLDEYIRTHSYEDVAFIDVLGSDMKLSEVETNQNYGFEDDIDMGSDAFVSVLNKYRNSFGVKVDYDFASEVAITHRGLYEMEIKGCHIDMLAGKASYCSEEENYKNGQILIDAMRRAVRYLKESNDIDSLIGMAKRENKRMLGE